MPDGEVEHVSAPKDRHHDTGMSEIRLIGYHTADDVPLQDARALLTAHVTWAYAEFRALGAPEFDVMVHVDRFFQHLEEVLPPKGAYFLVHGPDGRAVGTGALRRISANTGEMKHLYLQPEMRGKGLGEALVMARIEAARALGIKTLFADTFRGNKPMIGLYYRLGFTDAAPYESAVATITPVLIPHMRYFEMEL